jgi:hypothetical protein
MVTFRRLAVIAVAIESFDFFFAASARLGRTGIVRSMAPVDLRGWGRRMPVEGGQRGLLRQRPRSCIAVRMCTMSWPGSADPTVNRQLPSNILTLPASGLAALTSASHEHAGRDGRRASVCVFLLTFGDEARHR